MAGKKSSRGPNQKPIEKHGQSKTREYRAWADMITRCTNPKFIKWKYYGGKGVTVCNEWRMSFVAFREHMGECPLKHTLDRIDSSKGYEPGNCRWIIQADQMRNTGRTRMYTVNGRTQCLTDWAKEFGLTFIGLYHRLERGWTIEESLAKPVTDHRVSHNGQFLTIPQFAKACGIRVTTVKSRLNRGWSLDQALTTPPRNKCT